MLWQVQPCFFSPQRRLPTVLSIKIATVIICAQANDSLICSLRTCRCGGESRRKYNLLLFIKENKQSSKQTNKKTDGDAEQSYVNVIDLESITYTALHSIWWQVSKQTNKQTNTDTDTIVQCHLTLTLTLSILVIIHDHSKQTKFYSRFSILQSILFILFFAKTSHPYFFPQSIHRPKVITLFLSEN